jgi:hypothetical protein
MCTMLTMKTQIAGCGKSAQAPGWIALSQVNVGYDCPFHLDLEHALNLDFVNEAQGPSARVAVELAHSSGTCRVPFSSIVAANSRRTPSSC